MKDAKDTFEDIDKPLYREWRTTRNGMRYMVSSHRPLSECANVVMQKAVNVALKSISAATTTLNEMSREMVI
jgi:hypothetical protein